MTGPRLSAIIPSHGHVRFLPERARSILAQTHAPDELIVVDDGSTDGSAEWLRAWRSPLPTQLECRPTASGNPFAIWNAGAARAKGDWLWIAESDDSCHPDMLAALLAAAEKNPDAGIVFCQSELIDGDGRTIGSFADYTNAYDSESWRTDFALDGATAVARHLLARNPIPNVSACLLSRRGWQAAGGADSTLDLCGDWLTYARLLGHGSLVFLAAALNQHRHHPDTQRTRTTRAEYVRQGYEARRRIADLHALPDTIREFARRFAWSEAVGSLGVSPKALSGVLTAEARAAALAFDAKFDRRATVPDARVWDHCDVFFDATGTFTAANQRRQPVWRYDAWNTFIFRGGAGRVRLDPSTRAGECRLRKIALVDPTSGGVLWTADAASEFAGLTAGPGVQLTPRDGALFIVCSHDDPQIIVPPIAIPGRNTFDLHVEMLHPLE